MLELVRKQLRVIRAWRQMYLGANLLATPLNDRERPAAARDRRIDLHGDTQMVRFGDARKLIAEGGGPVVDELNRELDIVQEL